MHDWRVTRPIINGKKDCSLCLENKPLSEFYFKKSINRYDYLCKPCAKNKVKEDYNKRRKLIENGELKLKIAPEKKCRKCLIIKESEHFPKNKANNDGLAVYCSDCFKEIYKEKSKEKEFKIRRRYNYMHKRCRYEKSYLDKGIKPLLTIDEIRFLWDRDNADLLQVPSLDRIDNNGHYSLENCQFIETAENAIKDRVIKVAQKSMDGKLIAVYNSYKEAADATGVFPNGISLATRGKLNHTGGFIWERIEE